jgi:hypothetical protein
MKRFLSIILILLILGGCTSPLPATELPGTKLPPLPTASPSPTAPLPTQLEQTIRILVDDFLPQPYQGDDMYFYNRLEGDRGALNFSSVDWKNGQVTATIPDGQTWGGLWMSLNHPIREGYSINFSAILPEQIVPQYQSKVTGITISLEGTVWKTFRAELKDSVNNFLWTQELTLNGKRQTFQAELPPLQNVSQLVLVLDHAATGNFITIDDINLTATNPITDTTMATFVWSYGMLLNNWNPETGLLRDKARDASGEFDAIQATGSLAAATALAEQLGVVSHPDAIAIVEKIGDTLLNKLPRKHGLWPHWANTLPNGTFEIVYGTEWSSVDTVIAAIGLLDAQQALGLDTSATEQMLREINWASLVTEKGISHGYTYDGDLIPYAWDVFGGESWLVALAYASATGKITPMAYPSAPTANGSGFIDELAWLYVKAPMQPDNWGTDWNTYRMASGERQISYYAANSANSCLARNGLFGLSAGEVPVPSQVSKGSIYQAFGMGGQFGGVNDGAALLGSPVAMPHYSGMIASLQPDAAIKMWDWLIANEYFSPLNNVESLSFTPDSDCTARAEWNHLKGSWNLALQTLGWGRYLVERNGGLPATWQATTSNLFLAQGYRLLTPNEP